MRCKRNFWGYHKGKIYKNGLGRRFYLFPDKRCNLHIQRLLYLLVGLWGVYTVGSVGSPARRSWPVGGA